MNNNSQLIIRNHKDSFFKCTSGAVAISMAIMLPAIFTCVAFSINQAYTMRNRAKISEATNEASLAVIAIDNRNVDDKAKKQNRKIALNYINYFISKKIGDHSVSDANLLEPGSKIKIDYNGDKEEYYIAYNQAFNEFTEIKLHDGQQPQPIVVGNKTESYGNTRKYLIRDSFDFAFISDFSSSSTCQYSNVNCNNYSSNNNAQRRLDYMKEAITDIIEKYKDYPEYQFALVPYDIGVPVESQTKNAAGGQSYDCSVMYKMNQPYNSIDYNFWANKNIGFTKWSKLKKDKVITDYLDKNNYFPKHRKLLTYYMDSSYYNYYAQIIGPALGLEYGNNQALVDAGLCSLRTDYQDRIENGLHEYACGTDRKDHPEKNRVLINTQYAAVVQMFDYMFSGNYKDVHYSFANTKTVDVEGTIDTLFSDTKKNIITFERPISPVLAEFSPFMGMCQSPLYSNNLMNKKMIRERTVTDDMYKEIAEGKYVKNFESAPHLIPFSDDRDHNNNILTSIKKTNWMPGGGTDTITALLRTVPVMAKGNGNNKVMIIISDGKDDTGAGVLRDDFLDKGVCQAITSGLRDKKNFDKGYLTNQAKSAIIYYIKLNPNASNLTTDAQYEAEFGKWFTKCMNGNPIFLMEAKDRKSLTAVISKVIGIETGKFIKKNQNEY
ncbi:hypothetical protein J3U11_05230 [Gilliamella sp. B2840]|uniref:TadE/TadG family type IV pilus assembly protein n=1 Tax=unclassified Gilliamella TaxID=2685620 RepID=UPI00226A10F0|nr:MULTISPECIES: hypothetical protein [unclassified Gilliamella]MCX8664802.1 hypothetical protein [Gilliamella sp. B2887]MCX8697397.1 hypothetical protein [Gilliamella sp. B3000]MCX8700478.1 hypothetical protein [Gilliamella sp. B2840]